MPKDPIKLTEKFIKNRFQKYPKWSFNDWRVMYDHSLDVKNIAIEVAKKCSADETVVALAGLLHDIGKTYRASNEVLEKYAHDLNARVAKPLIKSLQLTEKQTENLIAAIGYYKLTKELKVMMDADAIAFFKDKRLHGLFFEWALKNNKKQNLKRHLDKYKKLHFPHSKKIAKPFYDALKKEWKNILPINK